MNNLINLKSLAIVFMVIIMSMSLVSAADSSIMSIQELPQPVRQGGWIDLPQGGSNGTAAWNFCNITSIRDPDHIAVISNVVMTKSGYSFNYTLNGAHTVKTGWYTVEGICGDGINEKPFAYKFQVTTNGQTMNISLWVSLTLLLIAIILLMIALYADNQYIGFITGIAFIICGIYFMIYGLGSLADLYTRTIAMVVMAFGLIVFFISAFHEYGDGNGLSQYFGIGDKRKDPNDYYDGEEE